MLKKNEKKGLKIYLGTVFGITLLMGLLVREAFLQNLNVSYYANVQMLYPAMGVMIAVLFTQKDLFQKAKHIYRTYLITGTVCILSLILYTISGSSIFTEVIFYTGLIGSLLMYLWIFFMDIPTRKRSGFSLGNKNLSRFIGYFFLFFAYRLLLLVCSEGYLFLTGERTISDLSRMIETMPYTSMVALKTLFLLIPGFFISFIFFFGEEYGWRYFLQPLLQKRFGICRGLILVGIIWSIWHLPITLYYYAPESPLQEMIARIVFCICLSFVMGYFYMKLNSIWLPAAMHYLYNGFTLLFSSSERAAQAVSADIISWPDVVVASVIMLVLTVPFFVLCCRMKEKCDRSPKLCE